MRPPLKQQHETVTRRLFKLCTRNQGGKSSYYGDLRDIGGGQVALRAPGQSRATTNQTEALKLLAAKIEEVENQTPVSGTEALQSFAREVVRRNPSSEQCLRVLILMIRIPQNA